MQWCKDKFHQAFFDVEPYRCAHEASKAGQGYKVRTVHAPHMMRALIRATCVLCHGV